VEAAATPTGIRACFVSASSQNVFFEDLSDAMRAELEKLGIATEAAVDHFPRLADDLVYVVVPHEYIALTQTDAHPTRQQLRRTVVIATEQPGTEWFDRTVDVAADAAATLDIHDLGVAELRRRGVKARRLALGYVPGWDYWHGNDDPRPIDATFLGAYTPRRGLVLARCGRVLQGRRAALQLVESWAPHTAADPHFLAASGGGQTTGKPVTRRVRQFFRSG
jgi:hypothetical protein